MQQSRMQGSVYFGRVLAAVLNATLKSNNRRDEFNEKEFSMDLVGQYGDSDDDGLSIA